MFKDVKEFPFLQAIIENHVIIQKEFLEAKEQISEIKYIFECENEMPESVLAFKEWVLKSGFTTDDVGYDARGDKPVGGIPIITLNGKRVFDSNFTQTYRIVENIPNLKIAMFSIMSPQAHILPHRHFESKGLMIFHMNLFDLDGYATFRVNDDVLEYSKEKDSFLFYPLDEHESINYSNSYRVTLIAEFAE
jgi:hypothetical protein